MNLGKWLIMKFFELFSFLSYVGQIFGFYFSSVQVGTKLAFHEDSGNSDGYSSL